MGATLRLLALGHLAAPSFIAQAAAQNITAIIANLEHYHAYGGSPPVYPSPQGTGLGDWAAAYSYAKSLVANMTNGEKQNLTIGYTSTTNGCSGNSYAAPSVGYPGMCLNDAGNGLRGTDGTSGYQSALHVGASWNRDLTLARASYMGKEFKAKGVNMALGPVVGPIGRVAEGGRNWEGFSNDPYLAGTLTGLTVQGLQESVIACTKHFIAYEQETNRNPDGYNASVSSNLDDKTMHELYLWPFQDAVHAGTGSVMCSYNRINGSYACQNSKTLNGLLKTELGFQGLVVSDWGGQHTGVASANAGLDMAMPDSDYWLGNLTTAVANGSLAQSRLDDMATRIIATWYKFNPEPNPGFGVPPNLSLPHEFVNGRSLDSASTILQGAVEGHVLVKNTGVLPLSAPPFLSIYGYDAYAALQTQEDSYAPDGFAKWNLGYESLANLTNADTVDFFAETVYPNGPASAQAGTLISGGGSGAVTAPYVIAPFDALRTQAVADGTCLQWDFENQNPAVDQATSACLVFINEFASEGYDRPMLADTDSDQLVLHVAARCNNTIVSINNAGIRTVDAWIDNPNITAVIFAHLPGQDSGTALVELLYGKQSFSGRLPYTVAKQPSDYGYLLEPTVPTNVSDYYTQSNFTEGVYIDYKSFIARNITPLYAFGYGLTYSNFSYSSLQVNKYSNASFSLLPANSSIQEGGLPSLWDDVASVSATITNTGKVEAAEVAQLYLGIPTGPAKQLRGYSKELLAPNASATVTFPLSRRDLSVWDTTRQQWILQTGTYNIYVGKSVLDIQLQSTLTI